MKDIHDLQFRTNEVRDNLKKRGDIALTSDLIAVLDLLDRFVAMTNREIDRLDRRISNASVGKDCE